MYKTLFYLFYISFKMYFQNSSYVRECSMDVFEDIRCISNKDWPWSCVSLSVIGNQGSRISNFEIGLLWLLVFIFYFFWKFHLMLFLKEHFIFLLLLKF